MSIRRVALACISIALLSACSADISASFDTRLDQQGMAGAADRMEEELKTVGPSRFIDQAYKTGIVRHVVLFRYKRAVSKEVRKEVTRRFLDLQKSPRNGQSYIVSIEEGDQISGERVDGGFEQAFVVTFRSQGDRNFYVGKPVITNPDFYDHKHQAFKEFVRPLLAPGGVLVFDYAASWTVPWTESFDSATA